jgi:hypothetical protein
MTKIDTLIEEIELDFIEFTGKSLEQRKNSLPIKEPKHVKALIWNLLSSEKYRKQISYNNYSQILDVWIGRLNGL